MAHDPESAPYFPVSPRKFIALSVLTWGLYELYWFYRNWAFIRARDGSSIVPWGRALFAPLWYPALLADLRRNLLHGPLVTGGVLAPSAIYLFLAGFAWRFPDPFWLLSFLSFLPLLSGVRRINAAASDSSSHYARNSRWMLRHWGLALLTTPALAFATASSVCLIPSTQVTPGWMLWGPNENFLERSAILAPGEQVLYFYSQGLLSFADDGNILSDRRVISYWTDQETGELLVESAFFSEIRDRAVDRGGWVEPTVLTMARRDGSEFALVLSTEKGGDKLFIRGLDHLLETAGVR